LAAYRSFLRRSRSDLQKRTSLDHQHGHYNGGINYFTDIRDGGHDWHCDDQPNYDAGYSTDIISEEACRIIATHNQTKQLFLYVPFNASHAPASARELS